LNGWKILTLPETPENQKLTLDTFQKSGRITASREQFCTVGFPNAFQRSRISSYNSLVFCPVLLAEGRKASFVVPVSFCDLEIEDYDLEDAVKE